MSDKSKVPERLNPFYETPEPGKEIELRCEAATLTQNETVIAGTLRVIQQWSPMRLIWEFNGDDLTSVRKDCSARLQSESCDFDWDVWGVEPTQAWGYIQGQIELGQNIVHEVHFHLPNFPNGYGADVCRQCDDRSESWLRLSLGSGVWEVLIESHKDYFTLHHDRREKCNVVLSGIGVLHRTDGAEFSTAEAVEFLDGLRIFLSFAFSEWCPPVLLVGTTADDSRLWERWANYDIQTGWNPKGWLGPWQRTAMTEAFPGFCDLWVREEWREPLQLAVTWLIEASRQSGGTEGAIAFGQIPLEMLAWLVLIEEEEVLSKNAAKRLRAGGRLEKLLRACRIPVRVPSRLKALKTVAENTDCQNGPQITTKVRNTIIHPDKKNRGFLPGWERDHGAKPSEVRWETKQLFKWYITLVLLSLMGYSGKYANRLTPHKLSQVELVPWVTPKEEETT